MLVAIHYNIVLQMLMSVISADKNIDIFFKFPVVMIGF
jgi:hypothetical protein